MIVLGTESKILGGVMRFWKLLVLCAIGLAGCGGGGSGDGGDGSPMEPAPVANADSASVKSAEEVVIAVIENDTGDGLSIDGIVQQPEHGVATVVDDSIVYRSFEGYAGDDFFTYSVRDSSGASTATVDIEVAAWSDVVFYKQADDGLFYWYITDAASPGVETAISHGESLPLGTAQVDMTAKALVYFAYDPSNGHKIYMSSLEDGSETLLASNVFYAPGAEPFALDVETDTLIYPALDSASGEVTFYRVQLSDPAAAQAVSEPFAPDSGGFHFFVDFDTDRLIYLPGPSFDTDLFGIDLHGPKTQVRLSPERAAGETVNGPAEEYIESNGWRTATRSYPTFSADGRAVYYLYQLSTGQHTLLRTEFDNPGIAQKMHPPLEAGQSISAFYVDPASGRLLEIANFGASGRELYAVDPTMPTVIRRINSDLVAGGEVAGVRLSQSGSQLVFYADGDTDEITEIYLADLDDNGVATKVNSPLPASYDAWFLGWSFDGELLAYRDFNNDGVSGYADGTDSTLYLVNRSSLGSAVALTQQSETHRIHVRGIDFRADSTQLIYYADETVDGRMDLILYDIATESRTILSTDITFMIVGFVN